MIARLRLALAMAVAVPLAAVGCGLVVASWIAASLIAGDA